MIGALRGCLTMLFAPLFSLVFAIVVGNRFGFWEGCLTGLVVFVICVVIAVRFANTPGKLTTADCIIPTILALISGVVFGPVQLFAGSVFSAATCIMSGILLSVALYLYKDGRFRAEWLILPVLTFLYELLPIELPTDLDNIFALGGSAFSLFWGRIATMTGIAATDQPLNPADDSDVIDISESDQKPVD